MELADYVRILRAHWKGVLCLVVGCSLMAAAYSLTQPKVYAANASGFVSTGSASSPAEASVGDSVARSRATSYVALAKSREVAARAAEELGLDANPSELIGRVSVKQPIDTVLIDITARAGTPSEATKLADAWVHALSEQVDAVEGSGGADLGVSALRLEPVESAAQPSAPVSPNIPRNVALGVIVGLMLGAAYAVLRSQLDRRLRTPSDIERSFGLPVLAAVPDEGSLGVDPKRHTDGVFSGQVTTTGEARAREAFLRLRTNLQFADVDDPPQCIVVSSPMAGDGKSTVALHIASTIASSGRDVMLIDADLRRPQLGARLGIIDSVGLTDVLVGRVDLAEVVQQVGALHVLPAGVQPPNPTDLLGSQTMARLLDSLRENYFVVLDAPPLLPVTDAAVLATKADGVVMVVTAGKTLDAHLETALGSMSRVNGKVLGVVLNRMAPRGLGSDQYYSSYYGPKREKKPARASGERAASASEPVPPMPQPDDSRLRGGRRKAT